MAIQVSATVERPMDTVRRRRSVVWRGGPPAPWHSYIVLVLAAVISLFPLFWMLLTAFRPEGAIIGRGLDFALTDLTLANFKRLFEETQALRWLFNSLVVAVSVTALALLLSTLAGFALAKYEFPGRRVMMQLVLFSAAIPHFVTIIPIYELMRNLNLVGSYASLILPFVVNPFAVFLARQYLYSLPSELLEAARIDGAGEFRMFFSIVLPLSRPLLGAVAIVIFSASWGELLWPLIMLQSSEDFTFPVGLASLMSYLDTPYGLLAAASTLFTLPLLWIFIMMQRQMIAGLTSASVKE